MGISEIITLIVALSGLFTGVLALRKTRAEAVRLEAQAKREREEAGKLEQEITDSVLARAKMDMDNMRLRICDLENANKKQTKHIEEQDKLISTLRTQLKRTDTLQRKRIRELEEENAELKERVEKLEKGDTGPLG